MQYSYTLLVLCAASVVVAVPVPLNINLGAYSPALVVGDGAIGFEGGQSVTNLMNTLQGAAASTAAQNGAAAPAAAASAATPATSQPAAAAQAATSEQAQVAQQSETLPQGMGKNVNNLPSLPMVTREAVAEADGDEADDGIVAEILSVQAQARDVSSPQALTAEEQAEVQAEMDEEDAEAAKQ